MIRPSRARYLLAEWPEPLRLSGPLPHADVFELYRRMAIPGRTSFLLESGKGNDTVARWSFLGSDPYGILSGRGAQTDYTTPEGTQRLPVEPWHVLAEMLRTSRQPRPDGFPPFFGGAVGAFSYDLVRRFDSLPAYSPDDLSWPDLQFAFVDLSAAVDHRTRTLHLIFAPPLDRLLGTPREKLYREGCDRLAELEATLTVPARRDPGDTGALDLAAAPEQTRGAYMDRILRCQEYIAAGDLYQANLSHRFTVETGAHARSAAARILYRRLRAVNPSPFSALLEFPEHSLVSNSPERLVRLEGRQADTRPIAGTRRRGRSLLEDRWLAEELLKDPKERAEHLMLVDLERNDLGRVCRYGSVRVEEFMVVERYSHVSHLVSNVSGELRAEVDGFDLIRAMFPGGTITGVPKIRCMEIIDELEPVRRGPYTGSLGYLSWSGDLDLNILIRTLALTGRRGYLQVGAGIVADSDPGREYDETLHKAEAIMEALGADG